MLCNPKFVGYKNSRWEFWRSSSLDVGGVGVRCGGGALAAAMHMAVIGPILRPRKPSRVYLLT